MRLDNFIEQFICHNSIIRLWKPHDGGCVLIWDGEHETCMEWEVLQNKVYQSQFRDCLVIGVNDICNDTYKESINIVIDA